MPPFLSGNPFPVKLAFTRQRANFDRPTEGAGRKNLPGGDRANFSLLVWGAKPLRRLCISRVSAATESGNDASQRSPICAVPIGEHRKGTVVVPGRRARVGI